MAHEVSKTPHRATASRAKSGHGKRRLRSMHIRRATNKGFIARHEYENDGGDGMGMGRDEEHVLPHANALQKHIAAHFGEQPGGVAVADKTVGDVSNPQEGAEEMPTAQGA